ncbi:hypothetical protein DYB32_007446 [Aphanomyces invadans]|uniref:Protein kinase domain-containing protein n=1 Tax=Aphanomyces invadans TaxID=157072 RepID=A0A418ANS7_9STRA|nr:hypothetical protein DYB32_007446 [Aphanomyces invadans]
MSREMSRTRLDQATLHWLMMIWLFQLGGRRCLQLLSRRVLLDLAGQTFTRRSSEEEARSRMVRQLVSVWLVAVWSGSVSAVRATAVSRESVGDTSHVIGVASVGALCVVLILALCTSRRRKQEKDERILTQRRLTQVYLERGDVCAATYNVYDVPAPMRSARSNAGSAAFSGFNGPIDDIKLRSEDIKLGSASLQQPLDVQVLSSQRSGLSSYNGSTYQSSVDRSAPTYKHQPAGSDDVIRMGSAARVGQSGRPSSRRQHFSSSQSNSIRLGHSQDRAVLSKSGHERSLGDTSVASEITKSDEDTLDMWRLDETHIKTITMLSRGASGAMPMPVARRRSRLCVWFAGAYGEVWYGEYRGTSVAIKKLLASRSTSDELKKFVGEIVLMAKYGWSCGWPAPDGNVTRLDCKFIVKFIGVSWFRKAEMMLVLEYMDQGDLRSILEKTTPDTFALEDKVNCALSVIEGLVYLHTLDTTIIHRDIKSRNVLLDSEKGTKLTDFGVSRESTSETMTIGIGTYRWMAPEILTDSHYSHAADIYSFGVILAELDMHILPYSDQVNEKGNPLNDTAIMGRVMHGTIQPTFSSLFPALLLGLAKQCLSYAPDDRPTSMEIAHQLRQFRKRNLAAASSMA